MQSLTFTGVVDECVCVRVRCVRRFIPSISADAAFSLASSIMFVQWEHHIYLAVCLLFMRCRKVRNPSNRYNPLKVFAWDDFVLNDKRGNFQGKISLPLACIHTNSERKEERERESDSLAACYFVHTKMPRIQNDDDEKKSTTINTACTRLWAKARCNVKQPHIPMVRLCRCHQCRRHCLSQFVVCVVLCYKEMRSENVFACARSFADTSRTWKEINYGYFSFSCFSTVILVYLTLFFSLWKPCFLVI